jgi:hypothetical protein
LQCDLRGERNAIARTSDRYPAAHARLRAHPCAESGGMAALKALFR